MKKLLLTICLITVSFFCNLFAQVPLVKEGATWHYGFHLKSEEVYGYVKMTYLGDAFVNNALHHRIREEEFTYDPMLDDVVNTDTDMLFIKYEVDSMFLSEQLVYSRLAKVGDTLAISGDSLNPVVFVYSHIDSTEIQGFNLQRQTITASCSDGNSYDIEVLDQVGIVSGPHKHFNWVHPFACNGEGGSDDPPKIYNFRCYMDEDINIMANPDIACDAFGEIISSTQNTNNTTVEVFPNPAHQSVQIKGISASQNLIVRDPLGRVIYQSNVDERTTIETWQWENGVYYFYFPESNIQKAILVSH